MLNKALETNDIPLKEYANNMASFKLWQKATEYGANRIMEQLALIKPFLSKKEAYAMFNKTAVDRALKSGELKTVKKGGKTSNVYILRKDFEMWMVKCELSSQALTEK